MVKRTTSLINLAGPYAIYGANVVAQCAKQDVAYADLSGETLFVKDMIAKYGDTAIKSGSRIIPVCGYEALPFDLGCMALMMEAGDFLLKLDTSAPRKMMGKIMERVGPKSGDGPKPERLDLWSYTIEFKATDDSGNMASATVTGKGQPSYKSKADIIGQVGILLATNDERLPNISGILTPASVLGLGILDDFANARLYFK